jgi:MFS family permease
LLVRDTPAGYSAALAIVHGRGYDGPAVSNDPQQTTAPQEGAEKRVRFGRTFASFGVRNYRVYFIAMFLYFGAMQMTTLARPWLAFDLSADEAGQRSALVLGMTVAANNLPSLVLSPYAGVLADRISKRLILQVSALLMAAFALLIAVGVAAGIVEWWHIAIVGVAQGTVMTFITPTRRAIIGDLVQKDYLLNATALHTVTQNVNRMITPALGGLIISVYGAEWAFVSVASMYGVALVLLFLVPNIVSAAGAKRSMSGAVSEGFRYAARTRPIRNLLLIAFVGGVIGQPLQHLLPLFADVLDITVDKVGLLFTLFGAGSLLGSTAAASLGDFRHKGLLLIGFLTFWGLAILLFSLSTWYWLSLVLMVPVGMGHSGRNTVNIATLQSYTDPEMRGRVMALMAMMSGFMPVSVLAITAVAEFASTQLAIGGIGVIVLAVGLWQLIFSRAVRDLE